MQQLVNGDAFPALEGESLNHGRISLPADVPADHWAVVLAYRAHW